MWMKASSASVAANATVITINSGESMANAVVGDAAILGDKPPVEVADSAQVNGAWQLSLQDPWPYEALNNVALRVQPNGGRFENAIGAMRRTNTTANNILAGMRDWLTSTEKTITVTDAGGKAYTVPTLANLGSAAQRDVGTDDGDVMEVGAFGVGSLAVLGANRLENTILEDNSFGSGLVAWGGDSLNILDKSLHGWGTGIAIHWDSETSMFLGFPLSLDSDIVLNFRNPTGWSDSVTFKTDRNTIVDSNGFIKSASPIIKLYPDHIENNALAADAQLTKNGTGDYTITGTLGLATEGWDIETPKDANGNIKVYVEYEQSEDDDGKPVINVRTYEPDYSSGPVSAGEPVDIPQARFITIRCDEPDEELDENEKDFAG